MSKWLNLFLENEIVNRSDKSDRFDLRVSLSGLSGGPQELLDEKKWKIITVREVTKVPDSDLRRICHLCHFVPGGF